MFYHSQISFLLQLLYDYLGGLDARLVFVASNIYQGMIMFTHILLSFSRNVWTVLQSSVECRESISGCHKARSLFTQVFLLRVCRFVYPKALSLSIFNHLKLSFVLTINSLLKPI